MTEPNKIFRQEDPLYCDGSSSKNFKFTRNSMGKRVKFRSVLKITAYILAFMLIAVTFMTIGLILYPNLVADCKRLVENEPETNHHYVSILGEMLISIGICKESNHETLDKVLRLNNNETESGNMNGDFLVGGKCKCPSSSESGNKTTDLNGKCICNETHKTNYSQITKMRNKSENYDTNSLNTQDSSHFGDFYFNETDFVNDTQSVEINACDCAKLHKIKNVSINGTYKEVLNISECKCPEITKDNLGINDTITESDQHDDKLLENRKCQCPKLQTMEDIISNRSESGEKFGIKHINGNECFCPEIQEMGDTSYRKKTTNESKKYGIGSMSITEASDKINSHLSETETGNERQSLKNECICPKKLGKNGAFLNRTMLNDKMHDEQFEGTEECSCPELLEIDNFDLNETGFTTEQNDRHSVQLSKCECSTKNNIMDIISNNASVRSHKLGFKTVDGECICPEGKEAEDLGSSKTINGNTKSSTESLSKEGVFNASNFHFNKSKTMKGRKFFKSDADDIHANKTGSVVTTGDETGSGNEKVVNIDERKTVTEELAPVGGTETVNEKDLKYDERETVTENMTNGEKRETVNEKEEQNGDKLETVNGKELNTGEEMETLNETKLINGNNTETLNGKEMSNDDDTETVKRKESNNLEETETANEKRLINLDETEKGNGKEEMMNSNETDTADEKETIEGDNTETIESKKLANDGITENTNDN